MEVVESDDEDEEFEADEDEEESNENVTGGMRLLRRGMVTMSRVNRRLVRGRKLKVKYNDDGEPVGRAAKEMQSYIGVFARTKVPINVKDWRLVPLSVKDNIWGSIEEAYVVPKQWKKMVFASAGQKWRDFKSKLTTWYIIPFMDSPELFEFPPDDYRSIHADQWQEFVKDRISPQFQGRCWLHIYETVCFAIIGFLHGILTRVDVEIGDSFSYNKEPCDSLMQQILTWVNS
ncbi:hypothetical protein ACLB2K_008234 [Fragaria x ananassa]